MKTYAIALFATLALAAPVHAHEGAGHASRHGVVKEQKPWGIAGEARSVRRTIDVEMTDAMRFSPSRIQVHEGETVRLRVKNAGRLMHELVIGTRDELQAHAGQMQKSPGMEHDAPYMTHVKPGARGEVVWNFNRPGEFEFACLIDGHFQAGMVGTVQVVAKKESSR